MFDVITAERIIAAMSVVSAVAFIATAIGAGFAAVFASRMWKISVVQEQIQRHQIPHDELTEDVRELIMFFDRYHVLVITSDDEGNSFLSPAVLQGQWYSEGDALPYGKYQVALTVLQRYYLVIVDNMNNYNYAITATGKMVSHRIKEKKV